MRLWRLLSTLPLRLRAVFRRARVEQDLDGSTVAVGADLPGGVEQRAEVEESGDVAPLGEEVLVVG